MRYKSIRVIILLLGCSLVGLFLVVSQGERKVPMLKEQVMLNVTQRAISPSLSGAVVEQKNSAILQVMESVHRLANPRVIPPFLPVNYGIMTAGLQRIAEDGKEVNGRLRSDLVRRGESAGVGAVEEKNGIHYDINFKRGTRAFDQCTRRNFFFEKDKIVLVARVENDDTGDYLYLGSDGLACYVTTERESATIVLMQDAVALRAFSYVRKPYPQPPGLVSVPKFIPTPIDISRL